MALRVNRPGAQGANGPARSTKLQGFLGEPVDLFLVYPHSDRRFIVIRIVSIDNEQAFGSVVAQDQLRQLEIQPR